MKYILLAFLNLFLFSFTADATRVNRSGGGGGSSGIGGSTGVTDSSVLLANGTGGATVKRSIVTIGATGAISDQLTDDVVGLTLRANVAGQTNKVFKVFRSNGDEQFSIDNNGSVISGGDFTTNNFRTPLMILEPGSGVGTPAWFIHGTAVYDALAMMQINSNKAGNRVLILQAEATPTANILELRDSSSNVLSSFNKNGNFQPQTYAGTALPTATASGEMIYNLTDQIPCYWNGSAWKRFDGVIACH